MNPICECGKNIVFLAYYIAPRLDDEIIEAHCFKCESSKRIFSCDSTTEARKEFKRLNPPQD